jgi:hypothetical protein
MMLLYLYLGFRRRFHKRLETSPYRTVCRPDFFDDPRSLLPHLDMSLMPPELHRPLRKKRRPAAAVAAGAAKRGVVRPRRDAAGGADDGAAEALLGEDGLGTVGVSADELRREEGKEEDGAGGGADGEAAGAGDGEGRRGSDGEGDEYEEGEEEEGDMEMADYAVGKVRAQRRASQSAVPCSVSPEGKAAG